MNELQIEEGPTNELQNKLTASLDKIQEYIDATEDFVLEQAPLVAQEIVTLGRVRGVAESCALLLASVATFFLARYLWRCHKLPDLSTDAEGGFLLGAVVTYIVSAILSLSCYIAAWHAFTPWLAPRYYLLKELSKLL